VGGICLKGFDLCVLKHQIESRGALKIDPAAPEPLLCAGIMLGWEHLEATLLLLLSLWVITHELQLRRATIAKAQNS